MDTGSQNPARNTSNEPLTSALAVDDAPNGRASPAIQVPVQGVLRQPRRSGSPRPSPDAQRRRSDEFITMSRSFSRQRNTRFVSPLQPENVIPPPVEGLHPSFTEPGLPPQESYSQNYPSPDFDAQLQVPDESTRLLGRDERQITENADSGHGSMSLSTAGSDSRMRQSSEFDDAPFEDDDPVFHKSVCMLGFSIITITSVVFVIVVSGLTTLIARRAIPTFSVSTDWPDGAEIPLKYGCLAPGGRGESFPLTWHNVPPSATNLVVLFANPGAIGERNYDPVHWFVTDIPVFDRSGHPVYHLAANASEDLRLMPREAHQRANVKSAEGIYYPPCPTHNSSLFVMHVYAVDASPVIKDFSDARKIMSRFVGVPTAKYSGTYGTSHRDLELADNTGKHKATNPKKGSYKKPVGKEHFLRT